MGNLLSDQSNEYLSSINVPPTNQLGQLKLLECTMTYFDGKEKITKEKMFEIEIVDNDDFGEINQEVEEAVEKAKSKAVA